MATQQYGHKLTSDTSVVPVISSSRTRPFQSETHNNQSTPRLQASSTTNSFDLTKAPLVPAGHPISFLNQPLQAKLTIGQPNDKYEQEADRVAHDVVQRIHASGVADLPSQPLAQRQNETIQRKPLLQPKEAVAGGEASSNLESSINQARGAGQPLDANLQRQMGQAMGADFSGVKVHTDSQADQLNRSIQAKAFTTGQDVFFRQGAYQPGSRGGQELIAHELTHVVQQNQGNISAINTKSLIQPVRERSNATTEAPDLNKILPVAKLHMHADLDEPDMGLLEQLSTGNVGHTWVALEWNDPSNVPDDIPAAHKFLLESGQDPFGFWPKKFEWHDYTGLNESQIRASLMVDKKNEYTELLDSWQAKYPDATDKEIMDAFLDVIKDDVAFAQTWGGIDTTLENWVGYSSNPFDSWVPGQVLHPDTKHAAKATQTYSLTRSEVDNVLRYAESKKDEQYSVFFYNCTTFAKEAVEAAGKPAPKAGKKVPKKGKNEICYPDKLYQSIKKNFEQGKGTTSLEVGGVMHQRVGIELENRKKGKKK